MLAYSIRIHKVRRSIDFKALKLWNVWSGSHPARRDWLTLMELLIDYLGQVFPKSLFETHCHLFCVCNWAFWQQFPTDPSRYPDDNYNNIIIVRFSSALCSFDCLFFLDAKAQSQKPLPCKQKTLHVGSRSVCYKAVLVLPPDPFTILEPWNLEISEFYVVQECRTTDFYAPNTRKGRSDGRTLNI